MRLDVALVERGLARSRTQAARLLAEGRVTLNGTPAAKASTPVHDGDEIAAVEERWVSRAAHKLLGALDDSGVAVAGRVLDAGASTGGFTQVCLDRGATRVYAVDVGHGQLAEPISAHPRVVVHEGLNLRDLTLDNLDGAPVEARLRRAERLADRDGEPDRVIAEAVRATRWPDERAVDPPLEPFDVPVGPRQRPRAARRSGASSMCR